LKNLLLLVLLIPYAGFSQTIEYSSIHWKYDDRIVEHLHFKQVFETPNLEVDEVRDRLTKWLIWKWQDKGIHEWRELDGTNTNGWAIAETLPYNINTRYRIWTKYLTCDECIKVFKNAKKATPARYRIDFRLKSGKIQIVMSGFWGLDENVSVEEWMVKKGQLIVSQDDPRVEPLRNEFNQITKEILQFIESPNDLLYKDNLDKVIEIDNW
jgi:hypothetical protein